MLAMQSNDSYEMSNDLEEVGSVMEGMTRKNGVDVTESVMLETAIELSATEPTVEPGLQPSTPTMGSIVHTLSQTLESEEFIMPVRREHVLEDALRSLKRRSFSPNLTLSVCLFLTCTHTYHLN